MRYNVWWYCPIHERWEKDCEGLTWDEAVEAARSVTIMTGQVTAIENGASDDLSVVRSANAGQEG